MEFMGVVLGGDMNSYAVSRAFYEAYGIKTIILGQYPIFPTVPSKITECFYDNDLLEWSHLKNMLLMLEEKYPKKKKFFFGNMDYYVEYLSHNKERIQSLSENFIVPIVEESLFHKLFQKETFYELCEKHGLNYPKYQIFDFKKDDMDTYQIKLDYPIFLKPSDTVIYAKYEFEGKQKGYKVESKEEFKKVLNIIKESGFQGRFIIQEYIYSDDTSMYVFSAYTSTKHKVQMISAGRILMHDRTPELIGNYNAIEDAYDEEFSNKIKDFLEKIKFTGICHFDVDYDIKRKKYYVFEMNIRQGRSNLYTLASGMNLAKLLVDDYIYHKEKEFTIAKEKFIVSVPPRCVLKYCLRKNGQKLEKKNFIRFGLAPYDRNLKRYYHQFWWSYGVTKDYLKYNKK